MIDFVQIDLRGLPKTEHEAARSIQNNLFGLDRIAEEFRQSADLYLFAHARKVALDQRMKEGVPTDANDRREMIGVIKIAGRNGAVVANSFSMVMMAINSTEAPTIWSKCDMTERSNATRLFALEFSKIAAIRTSAAHPGELAKSPEEQRKHRLTKPIQSAGAYDGGISGAYIADMMQADGERLVFGASVKGDWVEYELSMAKSEVLRKVTDHYCRTFYPLERPSAAIQRARRQQYDLLVQDDEDSRRPWWHDLTQL